MLRDRHDNDVSSRSGLPHSLGWNRDFRYRRNSGATMRLRGERPFQYIDSDSSFKLFFLDIILMYKCIYIDLTLCIN